MTFQGGDFRANREEDGWVVFESSSGVMRFKGWPDMVAFRTGQSLQSQGPPGTRVTPRLQLHPDADWNDVVRQEARRSPPVRWFAASRSDSPEVFETGGEPLRRMDPDGPELPYGIHPVDEGSIVDWYCRLMMRRSREVVLEIAGEFPESLRRILCGFQPQYQWRLAESGVDLDQCPAVAFLEAHGGQETLRALPPWLVQRVPANNCCPRLFANLLRCPRPMLGALKALPRIGVATALVACAASHSGRRLDPRTLRELDRHEEWSAGRDTLSGTIPLTFEVATLLRRMAA